MESIDCPYPSAGTKIRKVLKKYVACPTRDRWALSASPVRSNSPAPPSPAGVLSPVDLASPAAPPELPITKEDRSVAYKALAKRRSAIEHQFQGKEHLYELHRAQELQRAEEHAASLKAQNHVLQMKHRLASTRLQEARQQWRKWEFLYRRDTAILSEKLQGASCLSPKPPRTLPRSPPAAPRASMFEQLVVVGADPADEAPRRLWSFPRDSEAVEDPDIILEFILPQKHRKHRHRRTPSNSALNEVLYAQGNAAPRKFVFTLSVASGVPGEEPSTLYGCCVQASELLSWASHDLSPTAQLIHALQDASSFECSLQTFVLLSRLPFFELHFAALDAVISELQLHRVLAMTKARHTCTDWHHSSNVYRKSRQSEYPVIEAIAQGYFMVPVPAMGGCVQASLGTGGSLPAFTRPVSLDPKEERAVLTARWAVPMLVQLLSPAQLAQVLASALLENPVVYACPSVAVSSVLVLATTALLHPLTWCCLTLPVIPASLQELLESPVPYVAGVDALGSHMQIEPEMVLVQIGPRSVTVSSQNDIGGCAMQEKLQDVVHAAFAAGASISASVWSDATPDTLLPPTSAHCAVAEALAVGMKEYVSLLIAQCQEPRESEFLLGVKGTQMFANWQTEHNNEASR